MHGTSPINGPTTVPSWEPISLPQHLDPAQVKNAKSPPSRRPSRNLPSRPSRKALRKVPLRKVPLRKLALRKVPPLRKVAVHQKPPNFPQQSACAHTANAFAKNRQNNFSHTHPTRKGHPVSREPTHHLSSPRLLLRPLTHVRRPRNYLNPHRFLPLTRNGFRKFFRGRGLAQEKKIEPPPLGGASPPQGGAGQGLTH
jgi:hypothetical protein